MNCRYQDRRYQSVRVQMRLISDVISIFLFFNLLTRPIAPLPTTSRREIRQNRRGEISAFRPFNLVTLVFFSPYRQRCPTRFRVNITNRGFFFLFINK